MCRQPTLNDDVWWCLFNLVQVFIWFFCRPGIGGDSMTIAIPFARSKLRPPANDACGGRQTCDKQGSWEVENVGKCQTAGTYLVWIFCIILWHGSSDSMIPALWHLLPSCFGDVPWDGHWLSWFCSCWWDSDQFPRNICSWIKPYEV